MDVESRIGTYEMKQKLTTLANVTATISTFLAILAGFCLFGAIIDCLAVGAGTNSAAAMADRSSWNPVVCLTAMFWMAIPALVFWVAHCAIHNGLVQLKKAEKELQQERTKLNDKLRHQVLTTVYN
jgi:hypothetical protein